MSSILERSFSILEHLALHPEGRPLSALASELAMPLSATHRLLTELTRCGYVRQQQSQGDYTLTIKLVSIGLGFLSASGIVDIAQPLLDRLATASGELVRLAVVDGDALLSPGVTRRLIAEFAARSKEPAAAGELARLTEREREVMALVGIGLSNEEIARRLVVSPLTAKTHVSRTMVKLGARDRAQLVVLAYESGLVRPGWLG